MAKAQSPLLQFLFVAAILPAVTDRACATLPVRVSPEPNSAERAGLFEVAHDGSVLYQFGLGPREVNSVWRSVVGTSPQLLTGSLGQTRNIRPAYNIPLSPDQQHAFLWVAPETEPTSIELQLYRVPLAGGEPTPVVQDEATAGSRPLWSFDAYDFTPDDSELLYLSDHEQAGVQDLYAQSVAGGPARHITRHGRRTPHSTSHNNLESRPTISESFTPLVSSAHGSPNCSGASLDGTVRLNSTRVCPLCTIWRISHLTLQVRASCLARITACIAMS